MIKVISATNTEAIYWNRLFEQESDSLQGQDAWLSHCRHLYAAWVRQYLPCAGPTARVLKTDAFEETRGDEVWRELAVRFGTVVTMDVASSALRAASFRLNGSQQRSASAQGAWVAATALDIPLAASSLDAVLSLSTLDHLSSDGEIAQSLSELARLTKPGGRLLLTLDNPTNPVVSLRNWLPHRLLRRLGISPYRYGATVSAPRLIHMMQQAGWRVESVEHVLHAPRVACVAASRWVGPGRWLTPERFARFIGAWEPFAKLPTRALTGYFTLVVAERQ